MTRVRTRLKLGLAAVLAILVTVCGYSLLSIQRLVRTDAWVEETQETRSVVLATLALLTDTESGQRAYIITGDTTYLNAYARVEHRVESNFTSLERLTYMYPVQRARLNLVRPLMTQRLELMGEAIDARRAHRGAAVIASLLARERNVTDSLRRALDDMDRVELAQLGPRRERAETQANRAMALVVIGALVAIAAALILAVLLSRDLDRRLKSEALFHSVVDVLADGVFVRDMTGRIVECNPSAAHILGLSREAILGMEEGTIACFREDGTPLPVSMRPGVNARASGGRTRGEVMGVRRPNGEMRWLLVNAAPMFAPGTGEPAGVTTSFADITRRKEAEAAVREHREQLQEFLDNAGEFILITNADGRILYANRAWRQTLGYLEDADVIGRPVSGFVDPACRARYQDDQRRLISGDALHDVETTFVARDGRRVAASGDSNCKVEHGIPVAIRSTFRDMTERNVVQEQLLQAIEQASAANRAKSEFLANMSHELRTPLNSVIGFASVLMRNKHGILPPQEIQYLQRIHDNGRHLLSLINSVLDLSKVEAGRMELSLEMVDLGDLVRATLAQMESQVHGRPVTLRAAVPATLAPFRADAGKLKQVLINLVANAVKFTDKGSVTVRVTEHPITHDPLVLDVIDTGIGIPLDRQEAVFEAFRQADNSTARRFGGSGLGLTITRSLCQLMGYRITLASEPGAGTTFSVALSSEAAALPASPSPAPRFGGEPAVLIIDDEADARLLLSQFVRDAGCEPIAIGSGEQGLRLARERRPALILLDIMMPQMNGLEVLERLRADPALAEIPVAIVSIVASEQRKRAVGAVALIDKPVSRTEIEALLRRVLAEPPLDKRGALHALLAETVPADTTVAP